MPKGVSLSKGNTDAIASFEDPESVLSAAVQNPKQVTDRYISLYRTMTLVSGAATSTKTYAGAYVTRLMDKQDKTTAEIIEALGADEEGNKVSASRISQYRVSARLIFDLDFAPGASDTNALTSRAQNDKDVAAVIRDKDATHDTVTAALAKWDTAQAEKKGRRQLAAGKPNGAAASEKTTSKTTPNGERLITAGEAIRALTNVSVEDAVALLGLRDEISRVMANMSDADRASASAAYGKRKGSKSPSSPATA